MTAKLICVWHRQHINCPLTQKSAHLESTIAILRHAPSTSFVVVMAIGILLICAGTSVSQPRRGLIAIAAHAPITIGGHTTRISFVAPDNSALALSGKLLADTMQGHRLSLMFSGVAAKTPPGDLYSVYLDLPDGAGAKDSDPHFVGSLNFFGVLPSGSGPPLHRVVDMTGTAQRLRRLGLLSAQTSVTMVPGMNVGAAASLSVERIEIHAEELE